jgi:hypothetical protein
MLISIWSRKQIEICTPPHLRGVVFTDHSIFYIMLVGMYVRSPTQLPEGGGSSGESMKRINVPILLRRF